MLGLYVNYMYTLIHLQIKVVILNLFYHICIKRVLYNKTIVDYRLIEYDDIQQRLPILTSVSPWSILVVSVGYQIIFNDSVVNNLYNYI